MVAEASDIRRRAECLSGRQQRQRRRQAGTAGGHCRGAASKEVGGVPLAAAQAREMTLACCTQAHHAADRCCREPPPCDWPQLCTPKCRVVSPAVQMYRTEEIALAALRREQARAAHETRAENFLEF